MYRKVKSTKSVRTKEERQNLVGFSCYDCEGYYKHLNLSTEEVQKMKQKCSKHRAIIAPPPDSPKEMWKLEMSPDKEVPIVHEQLITRKKRRERAGETKVKGGAIASLDFGSETSSNKRCVLFKPFEVYLCLPVLEREVSLVPIPVLYTVGFYSPSLYYTQNKNLSGSLF